MFEVDIDCTFVYPSYTATEIKGWFEEVFPKGVKSKIDRKTKTIKIVSTKPLSRICYGYCESKLEDLCKKLEGLYKEGILMEDSEITIYFPACSVYTHYTYAENEFSVGIQVDIC